MASCRSFLLFAFLAALLLAPVAAAVPAPVPALVALNPSTSYFAQPAGDFQSSTNLTWVLSPDDPDQINGSLNYTLWQNWPGINAANQPGNWAPVYNLSHQPVPNRPGWVYAGNVGIAAVTDTNGTLFVSRNMTVSVVGSITNPTSAPSCVVQINEAAAAGGHDQCGTPILAAPAGVMANVNVTYQYPSPAPGNINVSWPVSTGEPNVSAPSVLNYRVLVQEPTQNQGLVTLINITDPLDGDDSIGNRSLAIQTGFNTTAANAPNLQVMVRAEDPLTHQFSNYSCTTTVDPQALNQVTGCGALSNGNGQGLTLGLTPVFPGLNVPVWESQAGLSATNGGWLLGALVVALLVFGGWLFTRDARGGSIGFALGVAAAVKMNLWQVWVIVVIFGVGLALIVRAYSGNKGVA